MIIKSLDPRGSSILGYINLLTLKRFRYNRCLSMRSFDTVFRNDFNPKIKSLTITTIYTILFSKGSNIEKKEKTV